MSLGWLTESSILPRKQKNIEGVSANTMVDLKALIYDKQSQNKNKSILGNLNEKKVLGAKNKNVEQRIQKDKAIMRQQEQQDVEKNLRKKAVLYEKMLKGELEDTFDDSLIDFDRKEEINEYQTTVDEDFLIGNKQIFSKDMENAETRKEWENNIIQDKRKEILKIKKSKSVQGVTNTTASAREKVKEIRREKKKKLKKRIMKLKLRSKKNVEQLDSD
eukprot:gene3193-5509_t